jgi:nitrite reductase/ring-hydroxylating ferredoxin subunit
VRGNRSPVAIRLHPRIVESVRGPSVIRRPPAVSEGRECVTTFKPSGETAEVGAVDQQHGASFKTHSPAAMREFRDVPPPYPFGWFGVAFTRKLKRGRVLACRFMDREIVVYRTKSGKACATEAYCPHMGAHLGHGGKVEGEELRCPFHGFRFSVDGSCVHTPFGAPPPAARLGRLEIREAWGVIFVWHGPPGQAPWELDLPDDELNWRPMRHWTMNLRSHPQEITENGIDIRHFPVLHEVTKFKVIDPLTANGPQMSMRYSFTWPAPCTPGFHVDLRVRIDGLGVSLVEEKVFGGWTVRQLTLKTPIGERETLLHYCATVNRRGRNAFTRALWSCVEPLAVRGVLYAPYSQLSRDRKVWDNKKYLRRPAIAGDDSPIPEYRRWSAQFYPEGADC